MFRIFICAVILSLFSAPSRASDEEHSRSISQLFSWDSHYFSFEERQAFGEALISYWLHFNGRVPRLSPQEVVWLEAELSTTETGRLERAINSEEFALYSIARIIDHCISDLNAAIEPSPPEAEALYWISLGTCFDEGHSLAAYLQRAGLSNGRFDGPFRLVILDLVHDQIATRIAPSAVADLMGWQIE